MVKRSIWTGWKEKIAPYVFLAPFLFFILVFFGYAFVRVFYFSFTDYDMFSPPRWVWFKNYANLFKEIQFLRALQNSLSFMLIVTAAQTALALVLAVALNQKLRGIKFFRAAYYLPSITSSVVITLIFMWFFQRKGLINFLLTKIAENKPIILTFILLVVVLQALLVLKERLRRVPVSIFEPSYLVLSLLLGGVATFLLVEGGVVSPVEGVKAVETIWFNTRLTWPARSGPLAIPIPLLVIMILNTWTTGPTFMLLYLAGLKEIPKELYEAAAVDGARGWQAFWHITVPQLRNVTFLVVTMGLIGTLQMFDQVAFIGEQAPLDAVITLVYFVYVYAFPSSAAPNIGMASAAAIFLAVLTLLIVLVQKRFVSERGEKVE